MTIRIGCYYKRGAIADVTKKGNLNGFPYDFIESIHLNIHLFGCTQLESFINGCA